MPSQQDDDELAEHVFAVNANIMAFTELRDLTNELTEILKQAPVGSLTERDREVVSGGSAIVRQDLEGHFRFVATKIPAQVDTICRLPDRFAPDFLREADLAALYFRQGSLLYEITAASVRLNIELHRHGLPALY